MAHFEAHVLGKTRLTEFLAPSVQLTEVGNAADDAAEPNRTDPIEAVHLRDVLNSGKSSGDRRA